MVPASVGDASVAASTTDSNVVVAEEDILVVDNADEASSKCLSAELASTQNGLVGLAG